MAEFRFKPAPVRRARTYRLEADRLTCHVDDTREWIAELDDISGAAFVSYKAHGRMIWRLDLMTGQGIRAINANLPAADAVHAEDFAAFHGLVTAVTEALITRKPDMQIGFGEHGRARHIIFGIGLISALGGATVLLIALLGGIASSRMAEAAVPILALIAFGAFLIRANNPWKTPPTVALALLPQLLTYLAGGQAEHSA